MFQRDYLTLSMLNILHDFMMLPSGFGLVNSLTNGKVSSKIYDKRDEFVLIGVL